MAISLSDNLQINAPKNIDARLYNGLVPYSSVGEVTGSISSEYRYKGLTVYVSSSTGIAEYWFRDGIANTDLILKTTSNGQTYYAGDGIVISPENYISASLGNGLTFNGTSIEPDLGNGLTFNGTSIEPDLGSGLIFDGTQIKTSIQTVNGLGPINGNIPVSITNTITGLSSSLSSSFPFIDPAYTPRPPISGTIFVVSGETGPASSSNGQAFIFVTGSGQAGSWQQIFGFNESSADNRYVKLTSGLTQTISSTLNITGSTTFSGSLFWSGASSPSGVDSNLVVLGSDGKFYTTGSFERYFSGRDVLVGPGNILSSSYSSSFGDSLATPRAVGGINSGSTVASLKTKTFSELFDLLLFPTLSPVGTAGSFSSTLTSPSTTQEIGTVINVSFNSSFTRGSWVVAGQSNLNYFGTASNYYFWNGSSYHNGGTTNTYTLSGWTVTSGSNNFPTAVSYSMGDQPVFSNGTPSGSAVNSGSLTDSTNSFTGVYPWFYGSSSAATINATDIVNAIETSNASASKVVAAASGNITAYFRNNTSMWCWVAHPSQYQTKVSWYQNSLNAGPIGTGNAFQDLDLQFIDTAYWSGIEYRIYASSYTTTFLDSPQYTVEFRTS